MKSLLIVGATGLVGGAALAQALADPRWSRVVAPTRRRLAETMEPGAGEKAGAVAGEGRLLNPVVDFGTLLADADWWAVDAVVCALGTTIKRAGSQEAFRRVDHDLPLAVARAARRAGAAAYVLVSSQGADAASRFFYLRVKGETEAALAACGYPSLTLLRPSLLGGQRTELRPGERVSQRVMRWLAPVIPRRYRMIAATDVARAALAAAWAATPGRQVVESEAIPDRAGWSGSGEVDIAAQAGFAAALEQGEHLAAFGLAGAAADQNDQARMSRMSGGQRQEVAAVTGDQDQVV